MAPPIATGEAQADPEPEPEEDSGQGGRERLALDPRVVHHEGGANPEEPADREALEDAAAKRSGTDSASANTSETMVMPKSCW